MSEEDPLDAYMASLPPEQVAVVEPLPRLEWRHTWPEGGADFVHREGHDFARITHEPWAPRELKWQWFVSIEHRPKGLATGGDAATKQEAADRATEAWHRLREIRGRGS